MIIGVIGEAPVIREDHVKFTSITLDKLDGGNKLSAEFDAIIIMKDHLSEAANKKYANTYKTAGVPFFFMESKKSYIPFIEEELK
ncbi:hypothetical protein PaeBR_09805 [Paenibacillus sp. BR2-3]|uniref:hypothetical protein n=1 Tax=Paenibacillus sp. BR2-3 TaxID=3048494 RepID=UPI003977D13E